ncbi:MAG TPA: hypothetical protein EYH09_00315 [Candidatus Nanopusillus sp.]|nr:hypothetical protein [Candidatus Nanopusillus sp.]
MIFLLVLLTIFLIIPTSAAVNNIDLLNAMDAAENEIKNLKELLSESDKIELYCERECLNIAERLFQLGKMKFAEGDLEKAYDYFLKAERVALEAQKSALIKKCNYTLKIVKRLIESAEEAGILVVEYEQSLDEAVRSLKLVNEKNEDIRDKIYKIKEIYSVLHQIKSDLQMKLNDIKNKSTTEIIKAERELEAAKYYPFFDLSTAKDMLRKAKEEHDGGRYLLAISYASKSRHICENIVMIGKIIYAVLIISALFIAWILYERSKPENRRSRFYRKIEGIFKRDGGVVDAW